MKYNYDERIIWMLNYLLTFPPSWVTNSEKMPKNVEKFDFEFFLFLQKFWSNHFLERGRG